MDGTKAAKQSSSSTVPKPLNWAPQVDDEVIQGIQKACFVRGKAVEDFFGTCLDQSGHLHVYNLIEAASRLGLNLQDQVVHDLH